MILAVNTIQFILDGLIVSLVILLLAILYKRVIKKWTKNTPQPADYVTLYSLENSISKGEVEFFFEQTSKKHVRFHIENMASKELIVLVDEECKSGNHIFNFDTTQLPDGNYYYVLKTDNQSTSKLMRIRNENQ